MAPGRSRSRARGWPTQVGLVAAGFALYLGVRAVTQGERTAALGHAHDLLGLERSLGLDWERAWQAVTLRHEPLRVLFDTVYASVYWPMIVGALVLLWRRDRRRYVILRDAMAISGVVGLIVFALYPVAPPRMLDGYVDTVSANARQHFIAHPSSFVNPYAALPSFHAGWVALSALVLAASARRWTVRIATLVPAALMAITVVATANHYVIDVFAGVGLSLLGALVAVRVHRARPVPPSGRPAHAQTTDPNPAGALLEPHALTLVTEPPHTAPIARSRRRGRAAADPSVG
jgi:uncharacterized membrane protein